MTCPGVWEGRSTTRPCLSLRAASGCRTCMARVETSAGVRTHVASTSTLKLVDPSVSCAPSFWERMLDRASVVRAGCPRTVMARLTRGGELKHVWEPQSSRTGVGRPSLASQGLRAAFCDNCGSRSPFVAVGWVVGAWQASCRKASPKELGRMMMCVACDVEAACLRLLQATCVAVELPKVLRGLRSLCVWAG